MSGFDKKKYVSGQKKSRSYSSDGTCNHAGRKKNSESLLEFVSLVVHAHEIDES